MKFKFIGQYTGGRDTINAGGVVFTGREAVDVTDEGLIARLERNPEFQKVGGAPKKAAE